MTSLLVLLAFLSVATLASRRGSFDELLTRASTPLLVLLGAMVSPAGLGFLPPSVLDGLQPAIHIGALWLAALAGLGGAAALRASSSPPRALARAALVALGTAALTSVWVFGMLLSASSLGHPVVDDADAPLAALLMGASLACLPGDEATGSSWRGAHAAAAELFALIAALVALALWSGAQQVLVTVALGLLGAMVAWLLSAHTAASSVIAVLAAATLVAGLADLARAPTAVAGLVAGLLAGAFHSVEVIRRWLHATERPVRSVVILLVAASSDVGLLPLAVGAVAGVGAILVGLAAGALSADESPRYERIAGTLAASTTPVAILAAFAHIQAAPATALLAPMLAAVSVTDTAAFAFSVVARRARHRTSE